MFIQRRTRTQSFLNAYGIDAVDAPALDAPQWTDRQARATRRTAWARRQSQHRRAGGGVERRAGPGSRRLQR